VHLQSRHAKDTDKTRLVTNTGERHTASQRRFWPHLKSYAVEVEGTGCTSRLKTIAQTVQHTHLLVIHLTRRLLAVRQLPAVVILVDVVDLLLMDVLVMDVLVELVIVGILIVELMLPEPLVLLVEFVVVVLGEVVPAEVVLILVLLLVDVLVLVVIIVLELVVELLDVVDVLVDEVVLLLVGVPVEQGIVVRRDLAIPCSNKRQNTTTSSVTVHVP